MYPGEKIIEIYKLVDGKYGIPEIYTEEDVVEVKYLGDLVINAKDVFR